MNLVYRIILAWRLRIFDTADLRYLGGITWILLVYSASTDRWIFQLIVLANGSVLSSMIEKHLSSDIVVPYYDSEILVLNSSDKLFILLV